MQMNDLHLILWFRFFQHFNFPCLPFAVFIRSGLNYLPKIKLKKETERNDRSNDSKPMN